jgi:DNA-binding protein YbaB
MNPDTFDPQRLLDQLEARIAKAKENAAALSAVQGWGEASTGYVKVCVGPSGVLQSIELDPRAMRLPSQDLAASIVAAAREGQQAAAAKIREIYATSDNNGGIDVASIAQGEYDVSQYIDERLEKARAMIRNARY